MATISEKQFIEFFTGKNSFTRQDIEHYFRRKEGEIKPGTLGWRIYNLKQKNIIREIMRNQYTLDTKPIYLPVVSQEMEAISWDFTRHYKDALYCLWDLNWLNEFTLHQFHRREILFEIEKDLEESVSDYFADKNQYGILRKLKGYLISIKSPLIPLVFFPLVTRAPVQKIIAKKKHNIAVPTLEKLLVDVYCNKEIFNFVEGAETVNIFANSLKHYAINFTTLFGYAKRRGKEKELRAFFHTHFLEI